MEIKPGSDGGPKNSISSNTHPNIKIEEVKDFVCRTSREKAAVRLNMVARTLGEANDDGDENFERRLISALSVFEFGLLAFTFLLIIQSLFTNKLTDKGTWRLNLWIWYCVGVTILCGRLFINYFIRKRPRTIKVVFIEVALLFCLTCLLIRSPTSSKLEEKAIWSLILLLSCIFGFRIFCDCLLCLAVKGFLVGTCAGYLKSPQGYIWLCLNVVTWSMFLIDTPTVLKYVTRGIVPTAFVVTAWMLRTIAMKCLYASFYDKRFEKRIRETHFGLYILENLSMPPLSSESCSGSNGIHSQGIKCRLTEIALQTGKYTLEECEGIFMKPERNKRIIATEKEAVFVSHLIFENVAKTGNEYIEEEDLLRFLKKEELHLVLPLIAGKEESGRIDKLLFLICVASMYTKIKFLEHSQNDMKDAITVVLKFVIVLLIVILFNLWVILRGATTKALLFISSLFLLAVFTFGRHAKSTLDAMIFVFLKHAFDVGDRCVIDGYQVVIEKVSIFTTSFMRCDLRNVMTSLNSILATKSISNFNRSPEMSDTVEFNLDVSTSVENISALEDKIKTYIDSNPHLWRQEHSFGVMEADSVNKMKMRLHVTHNINFQHFDQIRYRRSNLERELRKIFQQLGINYPIHISMTSY